MVERTSFSSKVAAVVLILVNSVALIFSILLISIGIWILAAPQSLHHVITQHGNQDAKALVPLEVMKTETAAGLMVVGGFLLFLSVIAIYGAIHRSLMWLFMYAVLVLLLLLLECALLFYFSSDLVTKGLQERDGQWTHALRLVLKCCDYGNITIPDPIKKPPWSCCGSDAHPDNCGYHRSYPQDCKKVVTAWLDRYKVAIYASLVATHIVLASCSLIRRSRMSPSRSYS